MPRLIFMLIAVACIGMFSGITFAQDNPVNGGTIRGAISDLTQGQKPIEGVEVKIVTQNGTEYTIKGDHRIPIKMVKKIDIGQHRIKSLLQRVGESTIQRYKLSEPNIEVLSQSVLEVANTSLDAHEFALIKSGSNAAILELLLSHPDTKAAFAKHLNETQLVDYINFNKARQQRDRLAAAQIMTAVLDQVLSLTTDQRKNVERVLFDGMSKAQLTPTNILWDGGPHLQLHYTVVYALHRELNVSLDEILTETQAKVWQGMIKREKIKREGEVGFEVLKLKTEEIKEKEVDDEYDVTTSQLWQLTEAILTTHTELLSPLHEHTSQRLTLVTKGVVQQYFETRNNTQDDDFETIPETLGELMNAYEAGKITREEALRKLNTVREELWDQRAANIQSGKAEVYDITDHPLYQQTIKEVLSEDAFIQYNERQIERKTFSQQSLRDLTVGFVDVYLLLDDTQRKHFEGIAAQLTPPLLLKEGLIIMLFELFLSIDREMLSPWQLGELEK